MTKTIDKLDRNAVLAATTIPNATNFEREREIKCGRCYGLYKYLILLLYYDG